ncbi:PREDICTED: histone-lysine N-methyltransferase SETMAR-like [Acromyrmex echinatior]|uniref:histone-lysine N-methyltransferase SETMAR-like n=1 Tax=Acromyrmex echinatior TaxID=103372 RepID=UPI000580CF21|nr:PREDICTED: histone-lysine N-methyltransferase SETMAR-like [Acromyrmex echinatior]
MESSTSRPATSIPIPSRVVLRGIIQFLFAQDFKSVDIHKQLVSVYGESVMSESMVRRWVREFKAGRHSLEDESGRGRPSLITDELTTKIENAIRKKAASGHSGQKKGDVDGRCVPSSRQCSAARRCFNNCTFESV